MDEERMSGSTYFSPHGCLDQRWRNGTGGCIHQVNCANENECEWLQAANIALQLSIRRGKGQEGLELLTSSNSEYVFDAIQIEFHASVTAEPGEKNGIFFYFYREQHLSPLLKRALHITMFEIDYSFLASHHHSYEFRQQLEASRCLFMKFSSYKHKKISGGKSVRHKWPLRFDHSLCLFFGFVDCSVCVFTVGTDLVVPDDHHVHSHTP
jgi:hypothetical protein